MRLFHIRGDQLTEIDALPDALPAAGYLWIGCARHEFEAQHPSVQAALQRFGGQLVDLHVSDLLNTQLPSNFDYTSWYDLLVFRRLALGSGSTSVPPDDRHSAQLITPDTRPVGFAVFDRVLLTVHPEDCSTLEFFSNRLQQRTSDGDLRGNARMPPSPADLALRMVNHIVDSYLALRRPLTQQLESLQQALFDPSGSFRHWPALLESRNKLHLLEDTCEDQRAAITEWIDSEDELPASDDPDTRRERELLRVRLRDLLEHIERVLSHVRRLGHSVENALQMHFSAQSNRTSEIMRTLTVLTAIFLPLNLVTGFFGMNFVALPLIHSARGFWFTFGFMLALAVSVSWLFWRKRYLGRPR